jgi:hypothetical protein
MKFPYLRGENGYYSKMYRNSRKEPIRANSDLALAIDVGSYRSNSFCNQSLPRFSVFSSTDLSPQSWRIYD